MGFHLRNGIVWMVVLRLIVCYCIVLKSLMWCIYTYSPRLLHRHWGCWYYNPSVGEVTLKFRLTSRHWDNSLKGVILWSMMCLNISSITRLCFFDRKSSPGVTHLISAVQDYIVNLNTCMEFRQRRPSSRSAATKDTVTQHQWQLTIRNFSHLCMYSRTLYKKAEEVLTKTHRFCSTVFTNHTYATTSPHF